MTTTADRNEMLRHAGTVLRTNHTKIIQDDQRRYWVFTFNKGNWAQGPFKLSVEADGSGTLRTGSDCVRVDRWIIAGVGYIASRAPSNGEPIATLVTRSDEGLWCLPPDGGSIRRHCPIERDVLVHERAEQAIAEAKKQWSR